MGDTVTDGDAGEVVSNVSVTVSIAVTEDSSVKLGD